ncbi:hypothetical protein EV175_006480 [Coemansia sp. RSA 1933]|nr:hypothetical protein EV175_006480 [Coemansia sp. RSA 1933]
MVGDPIFLIGKDEVRYYGMLSQVNEADRTITLEHARCLGTEGRIGIADKEIPASSTVFELIRFRADEVKHVEFVADSANAAPAAPAAPAPAAPSQPVAAAPAPVSSKPTGTGGVGTYEPGEASAQNKQKQALGASGAGGPSQTGGYRGQQGTYQATSEGAEDGGYQARYQNRQGGGYQGRGGRGRGGYNNNRGTGRGRGGGYQGRGGYQGNRYGQNRRVEVPESDFDFETSNSKLDKDELAKEFAKLNVKVNEGNEGYAEASTSAIGGGTSAGAARDAGASATDSYAPKQSFFDDISSEVKERTQMQEGGLSYEERRSRMNAERQQNYETFGQTTVDPNRHRYNRYGGNRGGGAGSSGYYNQGGNSNWRGGRGGRGGYNRGRGNYTNSQGYRNAPGGYSQQQQHTSGGNNDGSGLVESGAQA